MLLQAHSFIVFLHPNAAMQRQLIDLNPFHETECQTAVVQEQARKYFCLATKSMKSVSVLVFWYSRGWVSVTRKNPKAISWLNLKNMPRQFHLTSMQQTTNRHCLFNYTLILECNRKTSDDILHNTLHKLVPSVVVRVQSGSVLPSFRLSLQAQPLLLLMALSLRSDKPCRQSSIRTTSSRFLERGGGLYCTLKDKERRPRLTSESSRMPLLSLQFVVLWASFKNDKSCIFFN